MKKILVSCMVLAIAFYACKKDDKKSVSNIAPTNAQALSDAVKLAHATTVKGSLPTASGTGLSLDASADTIYAINGRYAVIKPSLTGTSVPNGYYVQINGADSYFNVDYSNKTTVRQAAKQKAPLLMRAQDNNNDDSAIVIKLPQNLSGGVFTVSYAAYDTVKNVSNIVKVIIAVYANDATSGDAKALTGTWKLTGEKLPGADWNHIVYGLDSVMYAFTCNEGDEGIHFTEQGVDEDSTHYALYYNQVSTADVTLSGDNTWTSVYNSNHKQLALDTSTCGHPYYYSYPDNSVEVGGWVYDAGKKTITVVYDSQWDYDVEIYPVTISGNTFVITDSYDGYSEEYTKK